MVGELYVTCFKKPLSDDFIQFMSEQHLGCQRYMALNAAASPSEMVQLTITGATTAAVAKAIYDFLKARTIEFVLEIKLESKTTTIGKQSSEKEIEAAIEQNKLQHFILKAKI